MTSTSPIAVYPGSFDPITLGHVEIVERSARLFAKVLVAVGQHPHKRGFFTTEERVDLISKSIETIPNAEACAYEGLTLDFCRARGATVIIRGLRAVADFDGEFQMGLANRDLAPEIETVFLIPRPSLQFISSSLIREIAMYGGNFSRYVTKPVEEALRARYVDRGDRG